MFIFINDVPISAKRVGFAVREVINNKRGRPVLSSAQETCAQITEGRYCFVRNRGVMRRFAGTREPPTRELKNSSHCLDREAS